MEWSLGLVCGIAFVAFIMGLRRARLSKRGVTAEYDERQKQVRGKGAGCAFHAVLLYNALYALVCVTSGREFMEPALDGFLAVFVGMAVIGLYSVAHDAFFPPHYPWKPYLGLCLVIAALSVYNAVRSAKAGAFVADGRLTLACLQPAMALVFLALAAAIVAHQRREEKEDAT